jgi:hypothetical protein
MSEIFADRARVFWSGNRKSKACAAPDKLRPRACRGELRRRIENRKLVGFVALVVTLAMCGAVAAAQQPKKVPRIGYLSVSDAVTAICRRRGNSVGSA